MTREDVSQLLSFCVDPDEDEALLVPRLGPGAALTLEHAKLPQRRPGAGGGRVSQTGGGGGGGGTASPAVPAAASAAAASGSGAGQRRAAAVAAAATGGYGVGPEISSGGGKPVVAPYDIDPLDDVSFEH